MVELLCYGCGWRRVVSVEWWIGALAKRGFPARVFYDDGDCTVRFSDGSFQLDQTVCTARSDDVN